MRGIIDKAACEGSQTAKAYPVSQRVFYGKAGALMYAVIVTGGKQYKVQEGDMLFIEKLEANEGDKVIFDTILAVSDDSGLRIGTPNIDGKVSASVVKNGKGEKIKIFKYKSKKGYRRRQGHRQPYTKVQIEKIEV